MIDQSLIPKLHETYCQITGLHIECSLGRHYYWEIFLTRGFTLPDLVLVCQQMRRQVTNQRRSITCMSFHRLIGDLDNFEELLAEYRALQRRPRFPKNKAEVLRATGRPSQPESKPAQPVASLVSRLKFAKQLNEFRKNL